MIVVGDASIFIGLHHIDAGLLLPRLFGAVHLPDAVWREIFASPHSPPGPPPEWMIRHQVQPSAALALRREELDRGEAEAIQLALDLAADILLIDEKHGRRAAQQAGLRITSLVGILILARRRGEIPRLPPYLDRVRAAGFWLSDDFVSQTLSRFDERP